MGSKAAREMRKFLWESRALEAVVDFGHRQVFPGVTTYPVVTVCANGATHHFVRQYDWSSGDSPAFVGVLPYEKLFRKGAIRIPPKGGEEDTEWWEREVESRGIRIKNGYATLADSVFIGNFPFTEMTVPIIKASTGRRCRAIYPYDENGRPLTWEKVSGHAEAAAWLENHRGQLLKRSGVSEANWWLYGRSQAIKDTSRRKITINSVIKDTSTIKLVEAPAGTGVYGGLYILTDKPIREIEDIFKTDGFLRHVMSLRKYKRGGYYSL